MKTHLTIIRTYLLAVLITAGVLIIAGRGSSGETGGTSISKINHVIVIYQENRSFDGLYGRFPVANGINNATTFAQVDKTSALYATLPHINTSLKPPAPDARFPVNLPVAPFDISLYVPATQTTGDMVHRFYQNQYQIDGGKMDKFVAWSDAAGLVMGYYEATNMPEGLLAQQYTLCDNFFQSAFGGSFLNHIYLIAAAPPVFPAAPASITAQLDTNGIMTVDGTVTPDGFVVNTAYTVNQPHPATVPIQNLVPTKPCPRLEIGLVRQTLPGPGIPRAGIMPWPALPTPSSNFIISLLPTLPIMPMEQLPKRPI